MTAHLPTYLKKNLILPTLGVALLLLLAIIPAQAQEGETTNGGGRVQKIVDYLDTGEMHFYSIPNLKTGDMIYVYAKRRNSNLDPMVLLGKGPADISITWDGVFAGAAQAIEEGKEPLAAMSEFANARFLAANDDGGTGYDSALQYRIGEAGTYYLLLTSDLGRTFGDYKLVIGINDASVLEDQAADTGDIVAYRQGGEVSSSASAQELTSSFTLESPETFYQLEDVQAGDTLYAYAEPIGDSDMNISMILRDFGNKPLASANYGGKESVARLEYTFQENSINNRLYLTGVPASGDYRLLIGLNEQKILTGEAEPMGNSIVKNPIEVYSVIKLQQITGVDQKAENFGVVAQLEMNWQDPILAFSPDTCDCAVKNYRSIDDFIDAYGRNRWPEFTLFNQQGRRFTQNQLIIVNPYGEVSYVERFSATLQAPDFNFAKFPFDTQEFFIRVDALYPEETVYYTADENSAQLGDQLGEEEWRILDHGPEVSTVDGQFSRFSMWMTSNRHLSFYIFRIFVPIMLIITVSWITFFLRDYSKRIDVTGANLLLFIAFNFTVSDDLPRLGYLTFMDSILVGTFIISAFVILFNVYLRRLEVVGKESFVQVIDRYMIWVYPLAYVIGGIVAVNQFLL